MKRIFFIFMVWSLVAIAQDKVHIPIVDLSKDYPEQTLLLTDVAKISYVSLEATDESLIKNYSGIAMDDNRIVITDGAQGQIFFFDRSGKFLNRISKRGGGPEEYQAISLSCVDFKACLIYIWDYAILGRILVYDFNGKYVKKIDVGNLPWPDQMYVYDNSNLIIYCDPSNLSRTKVGNTPYFLINTETGKATALNLKVNKPISNRYIKYGSNGIAESASQMDIYPLVKSGGSIIISDFTLPLVYRTLNGKLIPEMSRKGIGELNNGNKRISSVQNYSDRYILLRSFMAHENKKTGEINVSEPVIILYDRQNKTIKNVDIINSDLNVSGMIESWNHDLPANTAISVIPTFVLERLHTQGKLSKQMEGIYTSLDEEANDLLVIIDFNK